MPNCDQLPGTARTIQWALCKCIACSPTGGIVYQIGKMQIGQLLAERRRQQGDRFDLREFHDDLVAAAWVPIELTRWEMSGKREHARRMLADRTAMPFDGPAGDFQ